MTDRPEPTPRLARRLTTRDAVTVGLGAMLGAGIFAAVGPAAEAAGPWLLAGLALAAAVAYANATSSAQLAALYPESGGTYVYARERLGDYWGFLAGWAFVVGKTASLGAMALTFGSYAWPQHARPLAVAAVVVLAAVNYRGIDRTARVTRWLIALVFVVLAVVVAAVWGGGAVTTSNVAEAGGLVPVEVLQAAGLLFFAFAGYARIATLGEEVVDPERTIPKAIPIALGIVVATYAVVLTTALLGAGAEVLAGSNAPLAAAVESGRWGQVAWVVRVGAAAASAGVLLSLLAGVSRTTLSMARRREMPRYLAAVHPAYRTPHYAELTVASVVVAIVLVADLRGAIGFSSFAVLTYYGLANASAITLGRDARRWPRSLAVFGVLGCAALAFALPPVAVLGGGALLAVGSVGWLLSRRGAAASDPGA